MELRCGKMCIASTVIYSVCLRKSISVMYMYKDSNKGEKGIVCVVHPSYAGRISVAKTPKQNKSDAPYPNERDFQAVLCILPETQRKTITIQ